MPVFQCGKCGEKIAVSSQKQAVRITGSPGGKPTYEVHVVNCPKCGEPNRLLVPRQ